MKSISDYFGKLLSEIDLGEFILKLYDGDVLEKSCLWLETNKGEGMPIPRKVLNKFLASYYEEHF